MLGVIIHICKKSFGHNWACNLVLTYISALPKYLKSTFKAIPYDIVPIKDKWAQWLYWSYAILTISSHWIPLWVAVTPHTIWPSMPHLPCQLPKAYLMRRRCLSFYYKICISICAYVKMLVKMIPLFFSAWFIEYLLWVGPFLVWYLIGQNNHNFLFPSCSDYRIKTCKSERLSGKRRDLFRPKSTLSLIGSQLANFPVSSFPTFPGVWGSYMDLKTLHSEPDLWYVTRASRLRKAGSETWILVYSCGRSFFHRRCVECAFCQIRQNYVMYIYRGKKLIKTEETFAKRPVLWTGPACDPPTPCTQQASRKVTGACAK